MLSCFLSLEIKEQEGDICALFFYIRTFHHYIPDVYTVRAMYYNDANKQTLPCARKREAQKGKESHLSARGERAQEISFSPESTWYFLSLSRSVFIFPAKRIVRCLFKYSLADWMLRAYIMVYCLFK